MTSYPTLCCSLAGFPSAVGQALHNAMYRLMDLPFSYVAFGVSEEPEKVVAAIRTLGIRGAAVTMPFKETVMPYLDRIDSLASEIGAVNTIVNEDDVLVGYNVDWLGVTAALESQNVTISDQRVAVMGAGGAARAVVFGLKQRGAGKIRIFNRTAERGRAFAVEMGVEFGGGVADLDGEFDIFVNATSAGHVSQPHVCLLPETMLTSAHTVFDVVPEPLETPLIEMARRQGCVIVHGYQMRLHQAAAQFELYTKIKPPVDKMESVLLDIMKLREEATKVV
ncbi:MAG: shikimate dehydrogenase [Pirellulaceae bacterium]|nr:shikimate dehydrogenase [Pirellulaceae bacterium]